MKNSIISCYYIFIKKTIIGEDFYKYKKIGLINLNKNGNNGKQIK